MAAQWTDHNVTVTSGGADLTFTVSSIGDEDATDVVIALHGFPQSRRCWRAVGSGLAAQGLRVIAPDQRGYSPGARPVGTENYRMPRLVDDVLHLADALGVERFHLLGHDWGAQVGWVVCERAADRVQTFTALSVPHPQAYATAYRDDPDQREAAAYIRVFWQPGTAEDWLSGNDWAILRTILGDLPPEDIDHYVGRFQEPGAMTAALEWYRAMAPAEDFPSTTVPTTYVWSTEDQALRRAGAQLCERFVAADYRFVVLDGVSHWIPDQAPEAVVDAVLDRVARA